MDKVFIFTCIDRWVGISKKIRTRVPLWTENYPKTGCFISLCDCSNPGSEASLVPIEDIGAEGVYLLYDDMPTNDLDVLFRSCQNDKKYILIHTNGKSSTYDFGQWNNCVVRHGMHENYPTEKYYCVFDILTDNEDNKLQRIIDKVFAPLTDKVLQFLHGCLIPQNQNVEFRSAWNMLQAALVNNPTLHDALENFMRIYDSSPNEEGYFDKLRILSQELLAFAKTH